MGLKEGHRRWTSSPTLFQIRARSFSIIFTLLLFSTSFLIGCGDDDLQGAGESISAPSMPTGPDSVTWYEEATYSAGGAISTMGHRLEYRFDLDAEENHKYSNWSSSSSISNIFTNLRVYVIKAQARCAVHKDRMSPWSEGKAVMVIPSFETVSTPDPPSGPDTTDVHKIEYYCASGAVSSKGHPVEYQLDFDAGGSHAYSSWFYVFPSSCILHVWSVPGTYAVKCRARCAHHPGVMSEWSEGTTVEVRPDPETEIVRVINTYRIGDSEFIELVDFNDAIPDTVPYNSWITVVYRGWDRLFSKMNFGEDTTTCMTYDFSYIWRSERFPIGGGEPTILHCGKCSEDSASLSIGSVEYEMRVRSVNQFGRPDRTPAEIEIVGNFDPTLDSYSIENHNKQIVEDGDTLVWDWWAPADSELVVPENVEKKRFYFTINASGHDHPKDPLGSGITSWLYYFRDLGGIFNRFARSGSWVEGSSIDVLSDTFQVVFAYSLGDWNGDEVFDNLPQWINKTYDFTLKGRDLKKGEEFEQYSVCNGIKQLMNVYTTGHFGRWTREARLRFHFMIIR